MVKMTASFSTNTLVLVIVDRHEGRQVLLEAFSNKLELSK